MKAIGHRALGGALSVAAGLLLQAPAMADLPAETLGVEKAISATTRVYVPDIAINNIQDGRLHVVDGDTGDYEGVIGSGFAGQVKLSNDTKEIYIATAYYSRGQRGVKTSIIEVWDAESLTFKYEIPISNKRAMALNYKWLLSVSSDSRWMFVQNSTPASSITVVDLQAKRALTEIDTPGCWGIYPVKSQPNRFGMLCGDGKVEMVTIASNGTASSRTVSEPLFDPDGDALFIQGEPVGDTYHFVSFTGNVVSINMSGAKATAAGKWSMVTDDQRAHGWRPGGYQPLALDPATGNMFVTMHEGGSEGSHKWPAKEIWGFNVNTGTRNATLPGHDSTALGLSRNGKKLYVINALKASLVLINLGAEAKEAGVVQIGTFPSQVEAN
ncbi:MAG: amine dehydrogenase [Betaproteobacteria bacterium]|nr:amine dehydrogenase [Betaproteobacteria bacterium]